MTEPIPDPVGLSGNPRLDGIIREATYLYVDTEYTSRGHWQTGRRWRRIHDGLGWLSALLAALSAVVGVARRPWLASALGVFAALLIASLTFFKPQERVQAHLTAGNRANLLNGQLRHFVVTQARHLELSDAEAKLDELRKAKHVINEESPPIPQWGYAAAKKGIDRGESAYQPDLNRLAEDGVLPKLTPKD